MEEQFNSFIRTAPDSYKQLYKGCIESPERPDYHPERYLHKHIQIVFANALKSDNPDLLFAALLHDIAKPFSNRTSTLKSVQIGEKVYKYFSNPLHPKEAERVINDNKDIQQWIEQYGANIETVKIITREHMRYKTYKDGLNGIKGGMKEHKRKLFEEKYKPYMDLFEQFYHCDNMVETFKENPQWF